MLPPITDIQMRAIITTIIEGIKVAGGTITINNETINVDNPLFDKIAKDLTLQEISDKITTFQEQYTQTNILKAILEEQKEQTKLLKKIYQ